MPGAWLTADDVIALIDAKIRALGADAFAHNGRAHLYSGPNRDVHSRTLYNYFSNHERAKIRAKANNAILIDDTAIGQYLDEFEGVGIYRYFADQLHLKPGFSFQEADRVMKHASRLFIEALWGNISTSVCGADRDRIYYGVEIPAVAKNAALVSGALLTSKHIEFINGMPSKKFLKLFKPSDYESASRFVCLSEMHQTLHQALDGPPDLLRVYLDTQELYHVDRGDMLKGTAHENRSVNFLTPEEWLERKQTNFRIYASNALKRIGAEIGYEWEPMVTVPVFKSPPAAAGVHYRV